MPATPELNELWTWVEANVAAHLAAKTAAEASLVSAQQQIQQETAYLLILQTFKDKIAQMAA